MTNAQIILGESLALLENGIIKGTGRFFEIEDEEGNKKTVEEPEAIHTYAAWKARGYQVKKGSKAVASFPVWKYTSKPVKNDAGQVEVDELTGEPLTNNRMFLKLSSFFTADQVEKIAN